MSSRRTNVSGANANVYGRLAQVPKSPFSTAGLPNAENLLLLGAVWRTHAEYMVVRVGRGQGSAGFGYWQKKTFRLGGEEVEVFGER